MRIIIFLEMVFLVLALIIPTAWAASISNYEIEIQIVDNGAVVSHFIKSDSGIINLNLPSDAVITDFNGKHTFSAGRFEGIANGEFRLKYTSKSFIERTSKSYFTADFKAPYNTENLSVTLILPEGAVIDKNYPPAKITSDGRHIILNWQKSLGAYESFPVFVTYKENNRDISWPWIVLTVLFVAGTAFLLVPKRKARAARKVKSRKRNKELHLLPSEEAVLNALKEGIIWQRQIQYRTGFSKAKLSRVIRDLEARGLVKKIPIGNTNKIKLK